MMRWRCTTQFPASQQISWQTCSCFHAGPLSLADLICGWKLLLTQITHSSATWSRRSLWYQKNSDSFLLNGSGHTGVSRLTELKWEFLLKVYIFNVFEELGGNPETSGLSRPLHFSCYELLFCFRISHPGQMCSMKTGGVKVHGSFDWVESHLNPVFDTWIWTPLKTLEIFSGRFNQLR